ncbi:MAG: GDP-mannose 4,6-dehydratase [Fimbriimonadaceae bacterium]|nr:GDP-mannose 4,6-dehydratase [Fimbriimonadaceae bacterium]
MAKRALVTGVTGQDGAYLAQYLLRQGYEVIGAYRRSASSDFWRLAELGVADQVERVSFDLLETSNILRTISQVQPDEIYNLAAQSFVALSFDQPVYTADADALGPARILEAIRTVNPKIRFYQASTSEMFGKVRETPQTESTPFHPRSPYGVAKLYGHWITVNYRESYGLHATSGILFNHESPLRGTEFVTRKITASLALWKHGQAGPLRLGNLDARRDWGFAGDYVRGMHAMLQADTADDYVLATGETHTVREFVELAAQAADIALRWEGEAESERAFAADGRLVAQVDPKFYRPAEVDLLLGDATKARRDLGWQPEVALPQLVEMMMRADLDRANRGTLRL